MSELAGGRVLLKLENLQHTGTFKLRGALNRMLSLTPAQRKKGVITASTGNHGLALAYGANLLGMRSLVFVPRTASKEKREAIERYGVSVSVIGRDNCEAQMHAREYAAQRGMIFVPPYNDPMVVAGQGTIAMEILEQAGPSRIDEAFVCMGGGGLISGVGGYLKARLPKITVRGASPVNSPGMIACLKAGKFVTIYQKPTLAAGSSGGSIVDGSITFDFCRRFVNEVDTFTEAEIANALLWFIETHHLYIDGSAALPVASFLRHHKELRGRTAVVVICGANMSLETLKELM